MTWLGVDLGEARVGLAMSDPELCLAHPEGNIEAGGDYFRVLDEVVDFIADHDDIDCVVVGLPLLLNGQEGKSAKKARRWVANLVKRLSIASQDESYGLVQVPRVVMEDERLSTVSAHHQLSAARVSSRSHRPVVDQQSAVVILQGALDRHQVPEDGEISE
ncbi:putative holliday junction resolvase [Bifidobacterium bohemicum]|uniref:Putative pre-16S rRNA nuclease n=1 Tax=Bifidobacterium bohemicum DSM 22767 TaxID=1437606 RepID=A0A086ZJS5_9BIFI|nr:Holliday junction resolvase RuvX [Bifidobacterium bohemicum]KFI46775.1 putative Holliday junction resolvase [Bifidobacterium bohemicum DSM 22767]SCB81168.1 putative holliday junction resolvase [Bifidobacterium bohemicum]